MAGGVARPVDPGVRPAALDEAALTELGSRFDGELIRPGDDRYEAARRVWNAMVDRRPGLIVRPRGTADVVAAVHFARRLDLEISVRGGGHSIVGHSVTGGGLMIDLSLMRGVRVDPASRRAWVQGGCLLADLDRESQLFGLATTGGVVSHTGVAGLTLGGGYGYLARLHGLACDNVASYEVVTADGDVLVATAEREPELFWALRGGGGNFGIVTSFEFRLHPVPPEVLSVDLAFALDGALPALRALRQLAAEAVDAFVASAAIVPAPSADFVPPELHGRPIAWASFTYAGDVKAGRRLATALAASATPIAALDETFPYVELQRLADASQAAGRRRYWKSHFVRDVTDALLEEFLRHGADAPASGMLSGGSLIQLGGAVSRVDPADSPFSGRDAAFDFLASASWDDPAEDGDRLADARGFADAIAPFSTGRAYVNGLEDEGSERVVAAYGRANHERLVAAKDRYDPANVFHLNQNIRPSAAG